MSRPSTSSTSSKLSKSPPYRFGRHRPVATGPRLRLANYMRPTLPTPPAAVDYSPRGQPALSNSYGNDSLGDCVIAGGYHIVATTTGNAGRLFTATKDQIIHDYSAIGHYVPGKPSTDKGCDEPTALNYWREHGFADGTKPLGWIEVDCTNMQECKSAMFLFENLYLGVELPEAWVDKSLANGFVWDVAGDPVPQNGHCIIGVGYSQKGVLIDTWGMIGTVTWAAFTKYFQPSVHGAVYVLLTPDQLSTGQLRAPNGIDWTALITDFDAMGGAVRVTPSPSPSASSSSQPAKKKKKTEEEKKSGQPLTLAEATALAVAGVSQVHHLLLREQAVSLVTKALKEGWRE